MIAVVPDRSLEQRRLALHRANEVRGRRAVLKRELRAGKASIVDLVVDPPDWLGTAHVAEILRAVPKLGAVKVNRMLAQVRASHSKTFDGMSERQREEIAALLRERLL